MKTLRWIAVLSLGILSQGCYRYVPLDTSDVAPDMEVRAYVTPAQRDALSDVLPEGERAVDGTVVANGEDEVLLQVPTFTSQRGVRMETLDQRLRIPWGEITELERKEKNQGGTYALTAGIAAATIGVVIVALGAGQAGETTSGGEDILDSLIPVVRLLTGR